MDEKEPVLKGAAPGLLSGNMRAVLRMKTVQHCEKTS